MKITHHTDTLLIVEDRPMLIGILIIMFVLIFVGVGLSMVLSGEWAGLFFIFGGGSMGLLSFWAFVRRAQAVFSVDQNSVDLRERTIFRYKSVRHSLKEISRAIVEVSHSGDNGPTRRLALQIDAGQSAGTHPVTLAYSNYGKHHAVADTINAWLDSARARH